MTDELAPTFQPPIPTKRSNTLIPAILLALAVGGGAGWFVGHSMAPSEAEISAKQFCSLGDGGGSNMLEIGGWIKAAEASSSDWQKVLAAVQDRCPEWRAQVVAKGESLSSP